MKLFSNIFRRIGVDLGTTRTKVWHDQQGYIFDQPTCIAVDQQVKKVVAVGQDAVDMKGRVADRIKIYHPVSEGLVSDPEIIQAFLRVVFQKVLPHSYFLRPIVMVSVPAGSHRLDRQLVVDSFYEVGAREVYLVEESLASAIGSDVPIADASGTFLFHLGGGLAEASVISFGNIVSTRYSPNAGLYTDSLLKDIFRDELGLIISDKVAEELKKTLLSLRQTQKELMVMGQDVIEGAPKEVMVSGEKLVTAITILADEYVEMLKELLESVPPELTSDIIDKGMLLTGGFASVDGLDNYLIKKLGISVSVVEDSDKTVIKGVSTALQHLELFKESLGYVT